MENKTFYVSREDLNLAHLPGKWGCNLVPSEDGKGWYCTPQDDPWGGVEVEAKFLGSKKKAAEGTSKAFAEAAKSAGLTPEDALKLTKLFRND